MTYKIRKDQIVAKVITDDNNSNQLLMEYCVACQQLGFGGINVCYL